MTTTSRSFRIDDLTNPILTDTHRKELQLLENVCIELNEMAVLNEAQRRTELDDFGPDDFRERLQGQLSAIASDPNRTQLGRVIVYRRAVRWASTRLKLQDLLKRFPEIYHTRISSPIIIMGPPRSGTSELLNLLATDARLRSLPYWESYEPIPTLKRSSIEESIDARINKCEKKWKRFQCMLPYFSAMHSLAPHDINEDVELQGPNFAPGLLHGPSYIPESGRYHNEQNQRQHYEYLKLMLKALQWIRGPKQWILKSPAHAEHIRALLNVFPDAVIVITHRDPLNVIQSAVTMLAYLGRLEFHTIDTAKTASYWIERIEHIIRSITFERHAMCDSIVTDTLFSNFISDEVSVASGILERAGFKVSSNQLASMKSYLKSRSSKNSWKISYNLLKDFGVHPDDVRDRFAFYYKHFPAK